MTNPKTPAEALRWAANAAQELAHVSEAAAMRLDDNGSSVAFVARGESRVLRKLEDALHAEADRLESAWSPKLSDSDVSAIGEAVSENGVGFVEARRLGIRVIDRLRNAGFAIVEVPR